MLIRPQHLAGTTPRRGIILLVVLALLALLAGVGLGFVYYAESEADAARIGRQAQGMNIPDVDPELLLSYYLGQLIYGTDDIYSSLRGHSLAASLFGEGPNGNNNVPFNGMGRLRYIFLPASRNIHSATPGDSDDWNNYFLLNYRYFAADNFLRDPGYGGARPDPSQPPPANNYFEAFNVPYTYPDENNFYLGAVKADGTIVKPSFHTYAGFGALTSGNPKWSNADGKYRTLRPRPQDNYFDANGNPVFLFPADGGGDVKNLRWAKGIQIPGTNPPQYYHNDSIWVDVGFPVMNGPDGRKFKPLFASFVLDMDNRVNLWMNGNLHKNLAHSSNQGWGRFAVNLEKVLNADVNEARQLIRHRYGNNTMPHGNGQGGPLLAQPHAKIDFNGDSGTPLKLPTAPTAATDPIGIFPEFAADWKNADATETVDHAYKFNYFAPANPDRQLPTLSNFAAFLRHSGTGSPALTSSFFGLIPTNMRSKSTQSNAMIRNMITPLSMDFNHPGAIPYFWHPVSSPSGFNSALVYARNWKYAAPRHNDIPRFHMLGDLLENQFSYTPPAGSEYIDGWRSAFGRDVPKVDLNRTLRDYPAPDLTTGKIDATLPAFANAVQDRQAMAEEIYKMLVIVCGAVDHRGPTPPDPMMEPEKHAEYEADRYLAQLAVNIVDYIDTDDYMTGYNWNPANPNAKPVVGTELPRLVINETYVQLDNHSKGVAKGIVNGKAQPKATSYLVNCWIELHNPFTSNHSRNGEAVLQINDADGVKDINVYQVVVLPKPDAKLRDPDNNLGTWDDPTNPDAKNKKVDDWGTGKTTKVLPADGKYKGAVNENEGFYVLGPKFADPDDGFLAGRNPNLATTYKHTGMSFKLDPNDIMGGIPKPTFLLQRLANPHLPENNNRADVAYNPYVTIDYAKEAAIADTRTLDKDGDKGVVIDPTNSESYGRRQPYAADNTPMKSQWVKQNPVNQAAMQPKHTFYRHNARDDDPPFVAGNPTLKQPFDWLVHLDRKLINPLELLHVSRFRPHEMTQEFVVKVKDADDNDVDVVHNHVIPWLREQTRMYRAMEFFTTRDVMSGTSLMGRVPGKININTIWDKEVFRAICDAQAPNHFTEGNVDAVFGELLNSRTPGGTIGLEDRPFLPLSFGPRPPDDAQYPGRVLAGSQASKHDGGAGLHDTILRNKNGAGMDRYAPLPPMIAAHPTGHPFQKYEMLTKIYNSITNRSNVFAVWVTVGFFEVHPDNSGNYTLLGREIGRADNRHVRHRFFSIIDRTELKARLLNASNQEFTLQLGGGGINRGSNVTVTLNNTGNNLTWNTLNGGTWRIQNGTLLVINPDTANEETVRVSSVNAAAGTFTVASVKGTHPDGSPIICRCNPGPWRRYNPRNDTQVVKFYSVIE